MTAPALREDVAKALGVLLAAGIPRPWDVDSPDTMVAAYARALRGITREALEAAVDDVLTNPSSVTLRGRPTFPTAQELLALARGHLPKPAPRTTEPMACPVPGCGCEGWVERVIGITGRGPQVRLILAHEERLRGAGRLAEVRCPHPGCGCAAVEVELPADFDDRGLTRGGPVRSLGTIIPGRSYRLWVWGCVAATLPDSARVPAPPPF